jgi:hypothetical protein
MVVISVLALLGSQSIDLLSPVQLWFGSGACLVVMLLGIRFCVPAFMGSRNPGLPHWIFFAVVWSFEFPHGVIIGFCWKLYFGSIGGGKGAGDWMFMVYLLFMVVGAIEVLPLPCPLPQWLEWPLACPPYQPLPLELPGCAVSGCILCLILHKARGTPKYVA